MAKQNTIDSVAGTDTKKIGFPRYFEYNCAVKYFVSHAFSHVEYVMPPRLTRRSDELGMKYAPDSVCFPFKTILGSLIEVLENGADTLIMPHGLCRLGYYGELSEVILRNLGYDFDFINLAEYNTGKKKDWIRALKRIEKRPNMMKIVKYGKDAVRMVNILDEITERYYEDLGFDPSGRLEKAYKAFIRALYAADSRKDIETAYSKMNELFETIKLEKPERPLRVGMVGEFFTVMDPFSNLEIEKKIAEMGVELHRWMTVSNRFLNYPGEKNFHVEIRDYVDYEMGPTSTANIWAAKKYADAGFDGLIHVKSAYCTPEIDIMPVLQNLCRDYKMPLLSLSFGAQTSDVGVETRLEAFYDMVHAKARRLV